MYKVSILFFLSCFLSLVSKAQLSRVGILRYTIIPADVSSKVTKPTDLLEVSYRMSIGSSDSLLMETFSTNQPVFIPAKHPSFMEVFLKAKPEDRLEIMISADSFYKHTMQQPLPGYIKHGDSLFFFMKIYDVMGPNEMLAKQSKADREAITADSLALQNFIKSYPNATSTKNGIYLIRFKEGAGTQPGIGDSVLIKFKTYLFDGKVVDKSIEPGFEFMVGAKLVIPGLEEAIRFIKEGSRYKLVIPYLQAYGADGNGVIPPFTSIVFDLELLKVK